MTKTENSELFYSVLKDLCDLNELATCSICTRIFEEPVLLHCGHTFCSGCIRENENQNSNNHLCPLCRKPISRREKYNNENVNAPLATFMRTVSKAMKDSAKKDVFSDYQFLDFMKRYKAPSPGKEKHLSSKIPVTSKPKNVLKSRNIPNDPKPDKPILTIKSKRNSLRNVAKTQNLQEQDKPRDAFDVLLESSKRQPLKSYKNKRRQSKAKAQKQHEPEEKILEFDDDKKKQFIVQWLMDSQNEFNRLTQTQQGAISDDCLLSEELVSISQIGMSKKSHRNRNKIKSKEEKDIKINSHEMRKCRSLEILVKSSKPRRKRRSISHIEEEYIGQNEEVSFCNDIVQMMEEDCLDNLENEFMEPKKLDETSPSNKIEVSRNRKESEEGIIPHTASTAWERMESLKKSLQVKEKKLNIVQTDNTKKRFKQKAANPDLELKPTTVNLNAMESFFNNHMNNLMTHENVVCEELTIQTIKPAACSMNPQFPNSENSETNDSENTSGNVIKRKRHAHAKLQYNKENSNTAKYRKKSNIPRKDIEKNIEQNATIVISKESSPNAKIKILAINTIGNAVNLLPTKDPMEIQQNNETSIKENNSKMEQNEASKLISETKEIESDNESLIAPNYDIVIKQNNSNNDSIEKNKQNNHCASKLNDSEIIPNIIPKQNKSNNDSLSSDDEIFKVITQKAPVNKSDGHMSVNEFNVACNTSRERLTNICEDIKSNIQMLHTYFLSSALDVQQQREILMDCLLDMKPIMNSAKYDKSIQAEIITVTDDKNIQTENQIPPTNEALQLDNSTKYRNKSMQAEVTTFNEDKSIQTENEGFYISSSEAFKSQAFKDNSMQTEQYVCEKCNNKPAQQKEDNYVFTGSFDNLEFDTQNFLAPAAKEVKVKELSVLNMNNSEHTVTQILRNLETVQSNTQPHQLSLVNNEAQLLKVQSANLSEKQIPRNILNQSKVQFQKSQNDDLINNKVTNHNQIQTYSSKNTNNINSFKDSLIENLNKSKVNINLMDENKTILEQPSTSVCKDATKFFNKSKDLEKQLTSKFNLVNDEETDINQIQSKTKQKNDAAIVENENVSQLNKSLSMDLSTWHLEPPHVFSSQTKVDNKSFNTSQQSTSETSRVKSCRRLSFKDANVKKRSRASSPIDLETEMTSTKIRKVEDLMFRSDVSVCFDTETQRFKPDTQAQGDKLDEVASLGSSGFNMVYVDQIWDKIEKGLLGVPPNSQKKEVVKTSSALAFKKSTTQEILEKCDQLINDVKTSSGRVRKPIDLDTKSIDKKYSENLEGLIDNELLQDLEIPFEIELKPKRQENFFESLFGNTSIVNASKLQKKNLETIISDFDDDDIDRDMALIKISDKINDVVVNKLSLKHKNMNDSEDELFLSDDDDVIEGTPEKVSYRSVLTQNEVGHEPNVLECNKSHEEFLPPPPEFQDMNVEDCDVYQTPLNETLGPNQQSNSFLSKAVVPEQLPLKSGSSESETIISLSPIAKEISNKVILLRPLIDSSFKKSCSTPKSQKQVSIRKFMTKKKMGDGTALFGNVSQMAAERKICIACSRLNKNQIIAISALTNKKFATYSGVFNSNVTHMIVSTNDKNCVKDHTMKFVCAVASGIWVLNFKWVQECLAKNTIVPEAPYEVLDVSGIPGPRESRLYVKQKPLLKGFKIHTAPSLTIPKEDIENVILLLGGKIVSTPNELLEKDGCICLIITETRSTQDFEQFENWLETLKVITVDIEWLSRSVGQYKLMSLRRFALCSDDSICELGYPSNLIENVPMSFTQSAMV